MGDPPRVLLGRPTLKTWAFTLAVSLLALAGTAVASHFVEADWNARETAMRSWEVETIESIPPLAQRKTPVVIIFGTSLIEAATLRAGLQDKLPASVKTIVFIGTFGSRAPIEDLVPVMRKAHPDLVLIEIESMRRPDDDPPLIRKLRHLELAVSNGFQGVGRGTHLVYFPKSCIGLVKRKSADVGNIVDDYRRWFHEPQLDRLPVLLDLQAAGIQVGVLDMPRAAELEAAAPNLLTYRTRMREALGAKGVELWSAEGQWPADLFCDMSHLDHDGAVLFDKWLSGRLGQALNLPQ
jgi:hypothetical protein